MPSLDRSTHHERAVLGPTAPTMTQTTTPAPRRTLPIVLTIAGIVLLLGVGAWLRWQYLQTISLYVDEFTTLWGAHRIMEVGAPIMPSGVLYTRGLLSTYLTAFAGEIGGLNYIVGRVPSLIFALLTIVAIFWCGRREWNARVGWLAALGLTLLPEAIVWGGRARFYAPLQFFALLAIWAAYAAVADDYARRSHSGASDSRASSDADDSPSTRRHLLFAAMFVLALFAQEQTVLLYPPLLVAIVWWRGWRYLLRPQVWPAQIIMIVAMALRFLIELWGQPGYFQTIQAERPYVGFFFDIGKSWAAYDQLLVAPERWLWSLGAVIAIGVVVAMLAQAKWRPMRLPLYHQATLFFMLPFAFMLFVILTLVGGQWRETRYLFLVQPSWLLAGAAGMVWLVERFVRRSTARWVVTAGLAVLIVIGFWRPDQEVLAQQVEGYDRVLAEVGAQRQPGDVVMSPQPPACAFVLGAPCDYYAVQKAYEEFVIEKDGVLVDRWTGAPLLNSAAALEQVIRNAPAVWFVSDAFRLATRYDEGFLQTVVEQFDPVVTERGVTALRAAGWRATVPATHTQHEPPLAFGPLALTDAAYTAPAAGQPLTVTLSWVGVGPIDRQINTSIRVIGPDEATVAQVDGPPARGIIPTNLFFSTPLPDIKTLQLPAGLAPGQYRIDVVAYDVDTVTPVAAQTTVASFVVQ